MLYGFFRGSGIFYPNVGKGFVKGLPGGVHLPQVICLGQGTAINRKHTAIPLQPDKIAVLVKKGIVALLGDAAAAGGNDQAGLLAQLCQGFGLPVPESRFAVLGEDIRDGFPCQRDDFFIRI